MALAARKFNVAVATLILGAWSVHADAEKVVYNFGGGSDGGIPYAGLTYERGALYGATDIGGGNGCNGLGCGYVYKLSAPAEAGGAWTKTILYRFSGNEDGAYPQARLTFDRQGNLYGTTTGGGHLDNGTVFELTPSTNAQAGWGEVVLHSFSGADGQLPHSPLIMDKQGMLYGTTEFGGTNSYGVAFRLAPPAPGQNNWTETVLHEFTGGTDGGIPIGGLAADQSGKLYGTTMTGGAANLGTVFRLVAPASGYGNWTETVLHDFAGGSDGAQPVAGLTADGRGNLYGPTTQGGTGTCAEEHGCGTVFKLSPPMRDKSQWTEVVLHNFVGGTDGSFANSVLAIGQDGTIFGATQNGGSSSCGGYGCGTLFGLIPPHSAKYPWPEQIVKQFNEGADGSYPSSIMIVPGENVIFGTTSQGGTSGCNQMTCGVVFKVAIHR